MEQGQPNSETVASFLAPGALSEHKLWQRAAHFAARKHAGQFRKDGKTPYFVHPVRVAMTVRHVFRVEDGVALAAALLHDVLEDTTADFDDLLVGFGPEVARAVAALSKDSRLPEAEREAAYDRQLAAASWQARLVKLADVFDNYCDVLNDEMRTAARKKALRAVACSGNEPQCQAAATLVKQLVAQSW